MSESRNALPFDAFLELLRARNYGVGLHEYTAAARLLSRWESVAAGDLGDALAALIGRSEEEVCGIRQLFDEIYAPVPVSPATPAPVDRWFRLRAEAWWVAALAALITMAVVAVSWQQAPTPPAPVESLVPPVVSPVTNTEVISLPPPPAPAVPAAPLRLPRTLIAGTLASGFLVTLAGFWLLKVRETRRRWLRDAWAALRATLPGPFQYDERVARRPLRLPKADVEDAATLLGRVFSRGGIARELDVGRTVHATLRRALLPTLVMKPRRVAEAIVVLEDVCQEMRVWDAKVQTFLRDLRRQGIALQILYFDGDLSRLSERPHRPARPIDAVLRHRPDAPVVILSSGSGLPAMLENDASWWRLLGGRPRTTWLTPVSDQRLWPSVMTTLPIDVWPMTRLGLISAARQLADADASIGPLTRDEIAREGRVTREDVERLKRLASLVPHPSPALLDALRVQFAPEVPDTAILQLLNETDGPSSPVVALTDAETREHANATRRESPDLEAAVRSAVLEVLRDSEPVTGSAAHERWQIALHTQRLQLADLRGDGSAAAAAFQALRQLALGPMGKDALDSIRLTPTTPVMASRMAEIERTQNRLATDPVGGRRLTAARPLAWAWPGLRELVPAALAASLVFVGARVLNVPRPRPVEHVAGAYALEYSPQPSLSAPTLVLSLQRHDTNIPRRIDLYRGETPVRRDVALAEEGDTNIGLQPGESGAYYQVRGTMSAGNLALSSWLWVTSDQLSFVLVDAAPWADVTITRTAGGDALPTPRDPTSGGQTPFTAALLPGSYVLRFENRVLTTFTTQFLTVPGPSSAFATLPNFDPAQAADGTPPPHVTAR